MLEGPSKNLGVQKGFGGTMKRPGGPYDMYLIIVPKRS
jgi:hypothetical protein